MKNLFFCHYIFLIFCSLTLNSQVISDISLPWGISEINGENVAFVHEKNNEKEIFVHGIVETQVQIKTNKSSKYRDRCINVYKYKDDKMVRSDLYLLKRPSIDYNEIDFVKYRHSKTAFIKRQPLSKEEFSKLYPYFPNENFLSYPEISKSNTTFYHSSITPSINTRISYFKSSTHTNDPEAKIKTVSKRKDAIDESNSLTNNGNKYGVTEGFKELDFVYRKQGKVSWYLESDHLSYNDGTIHLLVKKKDKADKSMNERVYEFTMLNRFGKKTKTIPFTFEVPHELYNKYVQYTYLKGVKAVDKVAYIFKQKKSKKYNPNFDNTYFRCIVIDSEGMVIHDKEFNTDTKFKSISGFKFDKEDGVRFSGWANGKILLGSIASENSFFYSETP